MSVNEGSTALARRVWEICRAITALPDWEIVKNSLFVKTDSASISLALFPLGKGREEEVDLTFAFEISNWVNLESIELSFASSVMEDPTIRRALNHSDWFADGSGAELEVESSEDLLEDIRRLLSTYLELKAILDQVQTLKDQHEDELDKLLDQLRQFEFPGNQEESDE